MDAYRAVVEWRSDPPQVIPVVVVDVFVRPPFTNADGSIDGGAPVLLCVRQDDGKHLEASPYEVRCTEPTYLAQPPAPEEQGDHEHDYPVVATPVIEDGRIVGMARVCRVCGHRSVLPPSAK